MNARHSRRSSQGLSLLALLAVAVVVAPAEGRAAVAHGAKAKAKRVVVSPRAGQVVQWHHVKIRVRSGATSVRPRVRLNGVRVSAELGRSRRGVRTLRASLSHGLRRGRNVLRVKVRRPGRAPRRVTVRFVVRTKRHLVGAGRDRRVVVGTRVRLRGQVDKVARHRHRPSARWKVVGRPRRGSARGARAGTGSAPAALTSPAGLTAGFRPGAPGTYSVRLAAGSDDAAGTDTVTLRAVPRTPLVDVDTMVRTAGQPGIKVGGTTYAAPAPTGNPSALVQVLVLERQTLGLESNTTYTDADQLEAALRRLDDGSLVIAALQQPGTPGTEPLKGESLAQALAPIGFPSLRDVPRSGGSLSVIGVPKTDPGDASINVDPGKGEMTGYLTPDQHLEYDFASPERGLFAVPEGFQQGCPEGQGPCDDLGGFSVVAYDAHDIAVSHSRWFHTGAASLSPGEQGLQARAMADYLNGLPADTMVEISADSQRRPGGGTFLPPLGRVHGVYLTQLADAIARVGGTRDGFNRAAQQSGPENAKPVYALLGWADAGEGNGVEAALGVNTTADQPVPTGELRRDRQYMWKPAQVSPSGKVPDTLEQLVMEPPGREAWPLDDDPGARKALAYLGGKQAELGSDPRSAYWTQGFGQSQWQDVATGVAKIGYPGADRVDFTEDQFSRAKAELLTELGWVGKVRAYMTSLSSPFSDGALSDWVAAQKIADRIYEEARSPKDETALRWIEFTKILLEIAGPMTGEASAEVANLMDFGVWLAGADEDGEPGYEELHLEADKLGAELVEQAVKSKPTFDRVGDIVVSDYHKLSVVGVNAFCNSDQCLKDYAFTTADQERTATVAYRGVERILYEKLLPMGFHYFQLNQRIDIVAGREPDPHAYECGAFYHPWYGFPAAASTSLLQYLDLQQNFYGYDVFVLAAPPRATDQHGTPPSAAILKTVFGAVSDRSNDPHAGGLGISARDLVLTAKHYGWEGGNPGQDGKCLW